MSELYKETQKIMKQYHILARKGLGQNFLINDDVVEKIIDYSNISKEDLIIEIGPGLGTLTKPMLEKAKKVICVELDPQMVEILRERFKERDNIQIINEDILKVDLKTIIKNEKAITTKVIANLPYYITTPIIMKLLEEKLDIEQITVMVQKEVAERLTTKPGQRDTGAITYTVNYYTTAEKVVDVPRTSFIPEPKVDSQVISLKTRTTNKIEIKDETKLFNIIKVAFAQRRKTLVNSLVNGGIVTSKEELEKILAKTGMDSKVRAENLTLEQFIELSENI